MIRCGVTPVPTRKAENPSHPPGPSPTKLIQGPDEHPVWMLPHGFPPWGVAGYYTWRDGGLAVTTAEAGGERGCDAANHHGP
jgi:hypothetical protein